MRNLIKDTYFPFGSQYYRAPSPHAKEWEDDLRHMAELGFNTVKFWVQWRWNHPRPDQFYFDDIDRLMDLAYQFKLRVMLNTILDVAPAWIYRDYPDASMLTLSGQRVGPQTQPHRQIGGLGYCFNHLGVAKHFFNFIRQTVRRYSNHPALEIWNVGSEPELTSSMAEMRQYAADATRMGDMLCYCDYCRQAFIEWCQKKYERIENLNRCWNRNYEGFDQIELPKTRNTFNDMLDWRLFFVDVLGENVRKRFEVAKEEDKNRHPLMCHHVFIQGFPLTSTANDPWNVGRFGDLHGFTQMDDTMMIDILRSCARDKPVISAEMLMLPGYTLELPPLIYENDIKRLIFSGIAGNQKGFIFWQFRPEILGREAPTWGLTGLDGSETPWLDAFGRVGRGLQEHSDFLLDALPRPADVAILYHPENQIFAWMTTGSEMNATDSLLGVHQTLYNDNYCIDFVHPRDIENDILDQHQILFLPFSYVCDEGLAERLRQWVEKGGILIAESYAAAWNRDNGHHEKIVPGYGLHQVFQARQVAAEPALADNVADIILSETIGTLQSGTQLQGAIVQEYLAPEGAEVWARFANGRPAVTHGRYGKGEAILIGSYISMLIHRQQNQNNARFLAELAKRGKQQTRPRVSGNARVRIDTLSTSGNEHMIICRNLDDRSCKAVVDIPALKVESGQEIFSKEKFTAKSENNAIRFTVVLLKNQTKVYRSL
ncbi:hypothetical protein GF407_15595 [candidate division KSB1 bacterium]|nr:hypothetical protein [candidate division KSB1 bacterium]